MKKKIDTMDKNYMENRADYFGDENEYTPAISRLAAWWNKKHTKPLAMVAAGIAVAVVVPALVACNPKVDEAQQKAYKNYLSAWNNYESAVQAYDKVENPEKGELPANLVIEKTLDDKAATDALNSETNKLTSATAQIKVLIDELSKTDPGPGPGPVVDEEFEEAYTNYRDKYAQYLAVANKYVAAFPEENYVYIESIAKVDATKEELPAEVAKLDAEIDRLEKELFWTDIKSAEDLKEKSPELYKQVIEKTIEITKPKLEKAALMGGSANRYQADINKIMAFDFNEQSITALIDITHSFHGNNILLIEIPVSGKTNYKDIINHPESLVLGDAKTKLQISKVSTVDQDKTNAVFEKASKDLEFDWDKNDASMITAASGGVDDVLQCGTTALRLYNISSKGIIYKSLKVKSDGNTNDFITDYLINGELNKTYRKTDEFTYEFSDLAFANFDGLENDIAVAMDLGNGYSALFRVPVYRKVNDKLEKVGEHNTFNKVKDILEDE